jgi:Purple acid Phosphatase, N-terminal domain
MGTHFNGHSLHDDRVLPGRFQRVVAGLGLWIVLLLAGCSGGGSAAGGTRGSGDQDPPIITDVRVSPSRTTALITWQTDELSSSTLAYGLTATHELGTVSDVTMVRSHQILLSGLAADTTYHFVVRSADADGNVGQKSGLTFKTTVVRDTTPPGISDVNVIAVHDIALVTWTTDELADSRIDVGLTKNYTHNNKSGLFVTTHQMLLYPLAPDTLHYFKVTSADPEANSASSEGSFKTTNAPDTTAPTISNVSVTVTKDSAKVTWTTDEPANGKVDYGLTSTYTDSQISPLYATSHEIQLTRLAPDTTYHFRITSADPTSNSTFTEDATFRTAANKDATPPKISNVAVITTHEGAAVTWTTDEPANSRVDFGLTNQYGSNQVIASLVTSHQIDLTGLLASTTYHFSVTSADSSGNSASSADATFRTADRPKAGSRQTITQYGITWSFDKAYPAGQFANGDWWVVGPIKIVKIDPPSAGGGRSMNGTMINPSPRSGATQGYDSTMNYCTYSAALNKALGVSAANPLPVGANNSLVSSISNGGAKQRPQIKTAAILTVLGTAAPANSFRPPYSGTDKSIKFTTSRLNYALLGKLEKIAKTPSLGSVERLFERPWIDHIPDFMGRESHPSDNMKNYGRDLTADVGIGALSLHLDYTNAAKAKLMVRFVQLGIDLQGVIDDGGNRNWVNNGGHASGRKWPILFAGMVLNDAKMKGVGTQNAAFGEDQQTFYVRETSPGKFNNGYGGYTSAHKDMPEWGIRHTTDPSRDSVSWGARYRQCCTGNCFGGFVLAARMMKAQSLWKHQALFDYMDRYIPASRAAKDPLWMTQWDQWTLGMWDRYRANY